MQHVPDPSWKLYGPPDDGFSDYIERFRENVLDNWTVGELIDKLPTKLNNDLWVWIEEHAEWEFRERQAAKGEEKAEAYLASRRNREDRDNGREV